jgi:hypothetical protein
MVPSVTVPRMIMSAPIQITMAGAHRVSSWINVSCHVASLILSIVLS